MPVIHLEVGGSSCKLPDGTKRYARQRAEHHEAEAACRHCVCCNLQDKWPHSHAISKLHFVLCCCDMESQNYVAKLDLIGEAV